MLPDISIFSHKHHLEYLSNSVITWIFFFSCLQKATTKNYFGATGAGANDVTLGTVCTSTKPFQVCIKTDAVEVFAATGTVDGEFELTGGLAINHQNGGRGFRMGRKTLFHENG